MLLFQIEDHTFQVQTPAIELAIPLYFDGPQPNSYGVPRARSVAYEGDGFVGDVRRGGSCNFETVTFTPHCNGTHTEGVGHLTGERLSLHSLLHESWVAATLISLRPRAARETRDSYDPDFGPEDQVIDRDLIALALQETGSAWLAGLVIRTLPNATAKRSRDYARLNPPFFTSEAMHYLRNLGVKHLLVDLPSVDRLHDEGKLSAHHAFWGLPPGAQNLPQGQTAPPFTLTEFIFVPNEVPDSTYLLELQVAPFMSDAAPSRPRLFALRQVASAYGTKF